MKNTIKYISILIVIGLTIGLSVSIANASIFDWFDSLFNKNEFILGAPSSVTFYQSIFPITDSQYLLGSSTRQWLRITTQNASSTAFSIPSTGYFNLNATGTMQGFSLCTSGNGACGSGDGTVTSVAMTVPTGLTISGSPITTSGTLALTLTAGYNFLTNNASTTWDAKQNAITDGTNLTFAGATLNVDDPFSITKLTATNASTTYATLPTFWGTNGTITNASSTYLTVNSSAFFPGSSIWNSSGDVGIGTISPKLSLSLGNNTQNQAIFGQDRTTGDSVIYIGSDTAVNKSLGINYDNVANTGTFYIVGDLPVNPLVIADGGNIGIGTTTPQSLLHVTKTGNATTSVEFGGVGQNKGTCLVLYDVDGVAQYVRIQAGAFVISTVSCK